MIAQERTIGRRAFRGLVVLGLMALLAACSAHEDEQSSVGRATSSLQQASAQEELPTVVIRAKRDSDSIWRIAANTAEPAS